MSSSNYRNEHSHNNQYQQFSQNNNHHLQQPIPGSKFHSSTTASVLTNAKSEPTHRKSKERNEEGEESPVTPDSTTEPPPRPLRQFQEGDDVFFHTDNGQHILGTVGQIHGQTCLILFGDGSQQWASFKRVKKLACSLNKEDEDSVEPDKEPDKPKTDKTTVPTIPNQQTELTCVSCGTVRRVPYKKTLTYSPHTQSQFNCRRCTNKSITGSSGLNFNSIPLSGPYNNLTAPNSSSRNSTGDIPSSASSSSSALLSSGPRVSKTACIMPLPAEQSSRNICFHCEKMTEFNDSVHCNLCERPCHLYCMSLSTPPLEGDKFWDVMCSACGTQNGNERNRGRIKVFSVRRNISSWSDVVHLILSCLSVKTPGHRYFDLDLSIIPFFENFMDRLHLPRLYKVATREDRKMFLNTALTNAKLRFVNGKEVKKKTTLWAVRNENFRGFHMTLPPQIASTFPNASAMEKATTNTVTVNSAALTTRQGTANEVRPKTAPTVSTSLSPRPPVGIKTAAISYSASNSKGKPGLELRDQLSSTSTNKFITNLSATTIKISKGSIIGKDSSVEKKGADKVASACDSNNKTDEKATIKPNIDAKKPLSASDNESVATESESEEAPAAKRARKLPSRSAAKRSRTSDPPQPPENNNPQRNLRVRPPPTTTTAVPANKNKKQKLDEVIPIPNSPVVKDKEKILKSIVHDTNIVLSPLSKISNSSNNVAKKESTTSPKPALAARLRKRIQSEASEDEVSDKEAREAPLLTKITAVSPPTVVASLEVTNVAEIVHATINASPPQSLPPVPPPPSPRAVKLASTTATGIQPKIAPTSPTVIPTLPLRPGRPKGLRNLAASVVPVGGDKDKEKMKEKAALAAAEKKEKRKLLLQAKGRGRPLGSSTTKGVQNQKTVLSDTNGFGFPNGLTTSTTAGFGGLSVEEDGSNLNMCSNYSLLDCAAYGVGYQIQCLPKAPKSKQEKMSSAKKVCGYFLEETPPQPPAFWTTSNAAKNSNRQSRRDLNDYDSYDVVARRVDDDGTIKFMVIWKDGVTDSGSDEDDDYDNEREKEVMRSGESLIEMDLEDSMVMQNVEESVVVIKEVEENLVVIKEEKERGSSSTSNSYNIGNREREAVLRVSTQLADCFVGGSRRNKDFFVQGLGLKRKQPAKNGLPTVIDLTDSS